MATIVMKAPTPMMMPSAVSSARSRWRENPRTAMTKSAQRLTPAALAARAGASDSMWPSRKTMTRLAKAAMSGSCVTSTIVMPRSALRRVRMPMISSLVVESRLPVGSSASSSGGSPTSARAMATRCCWPPESWFGMWSARSASPTMPSAASARVARSRAGTPA